MTKIPFFDLKKQNQALFGKLAEVFKKQVLATDFILGESVEKFESHFAEFLGLPFAVGVNSGLDALSLSLRALQIGPGDEVALPANSFIATALAVTSVGATPLFVDVEADNLLMDIESLKRVVSKKTKAVIPVHLYGQAVDMKKLLSFCRAKNLRVVEDACQAHGARMGKRFCGSFGDLSAFSFYPGKNLGAFGDGGIVTTKNSNHAQKIRLLRNYGSLVKYEHVILGLNTRLDALQAEILDVKLAYLDGWNEKRRKLAAHYEARLKNFPQLTLLKKRTGFTDVHHLYVVRLDGRDALKDYLGERGIGTSIHYPLAIHQQKAYETLKNSRVSLAVSQKEARRLISLPFYPEMSFKDVETVCKAIGDFLKRH